MARPPRLELPGVPQHVRQRGNNGAACFFNDVDRRFYLKCLRDAAAERGCAVHAYVLMTNHVHLLVTPAEAGAVGAMIQDIGRRYVRIINSIHKRTGSLWEGRFRASLIDSEAYLLACHRYIEENPVRAGMVARALDYPWSSHSHYAGARRQELLMDYPQFAALGTSDTERRTNFCSLFAAPVAGTLLEKIRNAISSDSALGSEAFCHSLEETLGRSVRIPVRGRPRKSVTEKLL